MSATLLVIHLIITLAMIVLVLLQRSEGGALGIGGGGGGNMFSSRGVGNALTKMTTILAFVFFLKFANTGELLTVPPGEAWPKIKLLAPLIMSTRAML